jgi:hypothetical protein
VLRLHVIPSLGSVKLSGSLPQRVDALPEAKLAAGLSPRTMWHIRAVLPAALNDAVRCAEVSRKAAGPVHPPRVVGYHVEPMSVAWARAIGGLRHIVPFDGLTWVLLSSFAEDHICSPRSSQTCHLRQTWPGC